MKMKFVSRLSLLVQTLNDKNKGNKSPRMRCLSYLDKFSLLVPYKMYGEQSGEYAFSYQGLKS